MDGTSVRYTIICMAQRIEAVCASILDTGTQDAPAVQYSLKHRGLYNRKEDKQEEGKEEKKGQIQRKGMGGCMPNNLCQPSSSALSQSSL